MTVSSFRDDDIRALMAQASSAGPEADSEPMPADSELEDTDAPAEPPRPQFFAPANANVYSELADLPPAPVPGPSAPGGVEAASPERAPEAPTVQTPAVQIPTVQVPTAQMPTVQMPTVPAPASEAPPVVDVSRDDVADPETAPAAEPAVADRVTVVDEWAAMKAEVRTAWRREDDDIIPAGGRKARRRRWPIPA